MELSTEPTPEDILALYGQSVARLARRDMILKVLSDQNTELAAQVAQLSDVNAELTHRLEVAEGQLAGRHCTEPVG